jgi:cell division protein ZapA (FtsZ GTPase activity inhibitor)
MSRKKIQVVIAGRNYPLTVNEDEEETVMAAVHKINTGIKKLQENYAVKDMQDLLAMTALRLATTANDASSEQGAQRDEKYKEEIVAAVNELKELSTLL